MKKYVVFLILFFIPFFLYAEEPPDPPEPEPEYQEWGWLCPPPFKPYRGYAEFQNHVSCQYNSTQKINVFARLTFSQMLEICYASGMPQGGVFYAAAETTDSEGLGVFPGYIFCGSRGPDAEYKQIGRADNWSPVQSGCEIFGCNSSGAIDGSKLPANGSGACSGENCNIEDEEGEPWEDNFNPGEHYGGPSPKEIAEAIEGTVTYKGPEASEIGQAIGAAIPSSQSIKLAVSEGMSEHTKALRDGMLFDESEGDYPVPNMDYISGVNKDNLEGITDVDVKNLVEEQMEEFSGDFDFDITEHSGQIDDVFEIQKSRISEMMDIELSGSSCSMTHELMGRNITISICDHEDLFRMFGNVLYWVFQMSLLLSLVHNIRG